jgi:hypothetical protein
MVDGLLAESAIRFELTSKKGANRPDQEQSDSEKRVGFTANSVTVSSVASYKQHELPTCTSNHDQVGEQLANVS